MLQQILDPQKLRTSSQEPYAVKPSGTLRPQALRNPRIAVEASPLRYATEKRHFLERSHEAPKRPVNMLQPLTRRSPLLAVASGPSKWLTRLVLILEKDQQSWRSPRVLSNEARALCAAACPRYPPFRPPPSLTSCCSPFLHARTPVLAFTRYVSM